MSVCQLPQSTIRLIGSTQVITSVSSVVKELIENSIDAGATVIDIKLEKNGLEKIEVRDNGSGICVSDITNVCLPNYTSKLYNISDLEQLRSYGFRGEALNSLCAVSNVSITTRTEHDDVASTYIFNQNGGITDVTASHQMKGTIVTVTSLFKNVPVRKQYYSSTKKGIEELRRAERTVKLLAVIHPKLRVTIAHNKCLIWQKTMTKSLKLALMQIYPHVIVKNLEDSSHVFDDVGIEMFMPKKDCNLPVLCQSSASDAVMVFVNKRPVRDTKIEKLIMEEMSHFYASSLPQGKCPICLISIELSPEKLDVNLEPNKTRVFMKDHDDILKYIREAISLHFYKQSIFNCLEENFESHSDEETNDHLPVKKLKKDDLSECLFTSSFETKMDKISLTRVDQSNIPSVVEKNKSEYTSKKDILLVSQESSSEKQSTNFDINLGSNSNDATFKQSTNFDINRRSNSNDETFKLVNLEPQKENLDLDFDILLATQESSSEEQSINFDINPRSNSNDETFNLVNVEPQRDKLDLDLDLDLDMVLDAQESKKQLTNVNANLKSVSNDKVVKLPSYEGNLNCTSENLISNTTRIQVVGGILSAMPEITKVLQNLNSDERTARELNKMSNIYDGNSERNNLISNINNINDSAITRTQYSNESNVSARTLDNALTSEGFRDQSITNFFSRTSVNDSYYNPNNNKQETESTSNERVKLQSDNSITLSQWSKGNVMENENILEVSISLTMGGVVMLENKNQSSKFEFPCKKKLNARNTYQSKDSGLGTSQFDSNRSVSSQMGSKDLSGFTNFAREIRSDIIKNVPGISFTKVASELASRWRSLNEDEKHTYMEKSKSVKAQKSNVNLLTKKQGMKKELTVCTSVEQMKNSIKKSRVDRSTTENETGISLISSLVINLESRWLYKRKMEIGFVNVLRLQEAVSYNRNLANITVPSKNVQTPINVNSQNIGEDLWKKLLSVERRNTDGSSIYTVIDSRFTKNGVKLDIHENDNAEIGMQIFITKVPQIETISEIEDLKELLYLTRCHSDLLHCRPANVKNFILAETLKNCAEKPPPTDESQINTLLQYWYESVSSNSEYCLHNQPVLIKLHHLSN